MIGSLKMISQVSLVSGNFILTSAMTLITLGPEGHFLSTGMKILMLASNTASSQIQLNDGVANVGNPITLSNGGFGPDFLNLIIPDSWQLNVLTTAKWSVCWIEWVVMANTGLPDNAGEYDVTV